jgi:hypothetical protein
VATFVACGQVIWHHARNLEAKCYDATETAWQYLGHSIYQLYMWWFFDRDEERRQMYQPPPSISENVWSHHDYAPPTYKLFTLYYPFVMCHRLTLLRHPRSIRIQLDTLHVCVIILSKRHRIRGLTVGDYDTRSIGCYR